MQGPGIPDPIMATKRGLFASRVTESHMRIKGRMGWKIPAETTFTRLLMTGLPNKDLSKGNELPRRNCNDFTQKVRSRKFLEGER